MERNEGDFLKYFKHAFPSGKMIKAAIEFITSKDWGKNKLEEINKISDKQLKASCSTWINTE